MSCCSQDGKLRRPFSSTFSPLTEAGGILRAYGVVTWVWKAIDGVYALPALPAWLAHSPLPIDLVPFNPDEVGLSPLTVMGAVTAIFVFVALLKHTSSKLTLNGFTVPPMITRIPSALVVGSDASFAATGVVVWLASHLSNSFIVAEDTLVIGIIAGAVIVRSVASWSIHRDLTSSSSSDCVRARLDAESPAVDRCWPRHSTFMLPSPGSLHGAI